MNLCKESLDLEKNGVCLRYKVLIPNSNRLQKAKTLLLGICGEVFSRFVYFHPVCLSKVLTKAH